MMYQGQGQNAVCMESIGKLGAFLISIPDGRAGVGQVNDGGGDGGGLFFESAIEQLDGVVVLVDGQHVRAAFGRQVAVVARVAAHVQHTFRSGPLEEKPDLLFLIAFRFVVVVADVRVSGPDSLRFVLGCQLGHFRPDSPQIEQL